MWDRAFGSVELLDQLGCVTALRASPRAVPGTTHISLCSSAGRDAAGLFQVVVSLISFIGFTLM